MGTIAARDCLRVLELTEQVAAGLLLTANQGSFLGCAYSRKAAAKRHRRRQTPFMRLCWSGGTGRARKIARRASNRAGRWKPSGSRHGRWTNPFRVENDEANSRSGASPRDCSASAAAPSLGAANHSGKSLASVSACSTSRITVYIRRAFLRWAAHTLFASTMESCHCEAHPNQTAVGRLQYGQPLTVGSAPTPASLESHNNQRLLRQRLPFIPMAGSRDPDQHHPRGQSRRGLPTRSPSSPVRQVWRWCRWLQLYRRPW